MAQGTVYKTATFTGSDRNGNAVQAVFYITEIWDDSANVSYCTLTGIKVGYTSDISCSNATLYTTGTQTYHSGWTNTTSWTISANGTTFVSVSAGTSGTYSLPFGGSSSAYISNAASSQFTVSHDSNGNATLTVGLYLSWGTTGSYPKDTRGVISGGASGVAATATIELTNTKPTRTITVSAGTGIASVSGGGTFDTGTSVTVTATLEAGYTFSGWYSGSTKVSASASYTFSATEDLTLTAQATAVEYSVTLTAGDNVASVSGGGSEFNYGDLCTLTATLDEAPDGYEVEFDGWYYASGSKFSASLTVSFYVYGNYSFTAKATLKALGNVRIQYGGETVLASVRIYHNGAWIEPTPEIYSGGAWKKSI